MEQNRIWESPDGVILKEIIEFGEVGPKPFENSVCKISISNCSADLEHFNFSSLVIGENESEFGYLLEICLGMMGRGEIAEVKFRLKQEISFSLHLIDFEFKGFIYDWPASEKYKMALKHKQRGVDLFDKEVKQASRRFGKALKLLCSIPLNVEDPPTVVDGINVNDIKSLKATLYNNLASCFLKAENYETVIDLCRRTLSVDERNVKALYRTGIAYSALHLYEDAQKVFQKLLKIEPNNKLVLEKLAFINGKVQEVNANVNSMIKKMFTM